MNFIRNIGQKIVNNYDIAVYFVFDKLEAFGHKSYARWLTHLLITTLLVLLIGLPFRIVAFVVSQLYTFAADLIAALPRSAYLRETGKTS